MEMGFWQKIMNISIQKKLVILVYSCVMILFVILTIAMLFLSNTYSNQQLNVSRMTTVRQINTTVVEMQKSVSNLADYFSIDPMVQNLLHHHNRGLETQLPTDIMRRIITYSNVNGIVFYNEEGRAIDSITTDGSNNPTDQLIGDPDTALGALSIGNGRHNWEYVDRTNTKYFKVNNSPRLFFTRIIKDVDTMAPIGAISIAVDSRYLSGRDNDSDGLLYMFDEQGNDLLQKPSPFNGDLSIMDTLSGTFGGVLSAHTESGDKIVVYEQVVDGGFTTAIIAPATPFVLGLEGFAAYVMIAVVLFVLLIFPLLYFISGMLLRPIEILKTSMLRFSSGDFSSSVSFRYDDEIGVLGQAFNTMVKENKKLIETTYVLKLREREAELTALQAQINPHFFYNLINNLQWSALRKKDYETAEIAHSIGRIFRITLNQGHNTVQLGQEKELLENYLRLQKVRYKSRLEYTLDFPEQSLHLQMPKLLIQPLVENAILHGMRESGQALHIRVAVTLPDNGQRIRIEIFDDGAGIPPHILSLLPDRLPADQDDTHQRFAIKNIYERLTLAYPDAATFTITSIHGTNTLITMEFPMSREEQAFDQVVNSR